MNGTARLLLTRPEEASRRFLAACEAAHQGPIRAIIAPVLAIRPLEVRLSGRPSALILTSANGAARAGEMDLGALPAWCVGPQTAATARRLGFEAVEAGPDADGLVDAVLRARPVGRLLHIRGEHARGDIAERLREAGLDVGEITAYRQEALAPTAEARAALEGRQPLVVPLFSPRSAALLAAWDPRAPLRVVAISDAVAEAARPLVPESVRVARSPASEAMVEATLAALAALDESAA
jgi:uroporphyrinogen-III synthase